MGASDFPDTPAIVEAARGLLREHESDRALRLLSAAIETRPADERLWIARLEIIALAGTPAQFLRTMREFLDVHPDPARLPEIVRFWKRLAPA